MTPPLELGGRRLRPRRLHEASEPLRVGDGDVGQRLTVQIYTGALETRDELAVRHVVKPRRSVDTDDPEPSEISLLEPATDVREVSRTNDRFLSRAVELPFIKEVALGEPQNLLAALAAFVPSFDPWHGRSFMDDAAADGRPIALLGGDVARAVRRLPSLGTTAAWSLLGFCPLAEQHAPDTGRFGLGDQRRFSQTPLPPLRLLGEDMALHRVTTLHLARRGQLESLDRGALALELQTALLLWLSHFSFPAARGFAPSAVALALLGALALAGLADFVALVLLLEASFFGTRT